MSSVAATVDISEQPRILEELEENEDAGQPVNNEDAGRLVAKMTAKLQVTDTDESFRIKSCQKRMEKELRKELMRAAQLEETRAVFKCGTYEVLKLLASTLQETFAVFEKEDTLKKAMERIKREHEFQLGEIQRRADMELEELPASLEAGLEHTAMR